MRAVSYNHIMSPELTRQIIVGSVAVFFTALFTGIPALLLFWWTWQRDQERLVVQKLFWYGKTHDGKRVLLKDTHGPRFGLLIRNRSLFSVRVDAVGFEIGGNVIQVEHPTFPVKLKRNPDTTSSFLNIPDEDADPYELPSGACVQVSVLNPTDRTTLCAALQTASDKAGRPTDEVLGSPKVIAMVALETGKQFTSMPVHKKLWRRALSIKREMDGQPSEIAE
jgi:hypothetical protein